MKTLVVFDFDHTLVDDNSDTWVLLCLPDRTLPAPLRTSYQQGRWTEYMGRVLAHLGERSVTQEQIRRVMESIPFTAGVLDLLTFIGAHKHALDCIVVSDSNSVFIDWILEAAGVRTAVDRVFTNPARFDHRGYMVLDAHHAHQCPRCPVNMCKRKVLEDFCREQREAGVEYQRTVYAGDGGNDLCPTRGMRGGDVVMPRRGFALERLLARQTTPAPGPQGEDDPPPSRPEVIGWTSGQEILEVLKTCVQ